MKVTSSEIEGSQVVLDMEIESERLDKAMDRAYRRLASRVNVPGFRRGKAPRSLLERMIGREALMEEALEILVPEAYTEAVQETGIDPVDQPKLDVLSAEPLSVRATVSVRPKVKLNDYRSIRQSMDVQEITEAQVNDAVENLRESRAQWVPAEREAAAGDMIALDIVARSDEDTFLSEQGVSLVLNPEREILAPGVVEQLLGMKAGDQKAFDVTLPESFTKAELAGKEAAVEVTVGEVKEKQLPEIDDEFAKSLGEYADLEALRKAVREELELQSRAQARRNLEESVLAAVVDQAEAEPPAAWVSDQAATLSQNTQSQVGREGLSFDQFLQFSNMTQDSFKDEMLASAKRQLKRALVLDAVADTEGIEVTDEELNTAVDQALAVRQGKAVTAEERDRLKSNLRSVLKERKTIDRLVQIAESEDGEAATELESTEVEAETGSVSGEAQAVDEPEAADSQS